MAAGDLVRRHGKWITEAPTHCPHGHPLGPGGVLVGHVACKGHGIGHMLWFCRTCPPEEAPTYGPPLGEHCTAIWGPASKRISTAAPEPERPYVIPEPPDL